MLPLIANAATLQPFVDVLAWQASETNSAWAETISAPPGSTNVTNSINSYTIRPGIKAGLSYLPDDPLWDFKIFWTYYATDASHTIPVSDHLVFSLFFSGSPFISDDIFFGAYSHWQLAMNMLDLQIRRHFKPLPCLTLSPTLGIKGGSINQDIDANWNAILYQSTENVRSDFTGIGPTIGLEALWNFYPHFNLVGNVTAGLMYGRWDMKDTYNRPASLVTTQTTITTSLNQSKLGSLIMDYFVGLQWTHEGTSRVTVQLGYEMQYWSNQLRLIAVQQLPAQGDLTLQGATCGVSIDL